MASDWISLARWWQAFCAGQIVSQASLTEMSTFYDNVESELPVDYGLGLFNPAQRASVKAVGHLGANFGYKTSAGCLTEDHVIFAVLTNRGPRLLRSSHTAGHGGPLGLDWLRGHEISLRMSRLCHFDRLIAYAQIALAAAIQLLAPHDGRQGH